MSQLLRVNTIIRRAAFWLRPLLAELTNNYKKIRSRSTRSRNFDVISGMECKEESGGYSTNNRRPVHRYARCSGRIGDTHNRRALGLKPSRLIWSRRRLKLSRQDSRVLLLSRVASPRLTLTSSWTISVGLIAL